MWSGNSGEDRTVLALRYGDNIRELRKYSKEDTMQTTGRISGVISEGGRAIVDVIGVGCFDDKTEVLTEAGWKLFADWTPDTRVLTMNPDTREASYCVPTKRFHAKYNGEMYRHEGQTTNFCVTPNHQMFYRGVNERGWHLNRIDAIAINEINMARSFVWHGVEQEEFVLDGFDRMFPALNKGHNRGSYRMTARPVGEVRIPMDAWLRFLGWVLSEGTTCRNLYSVGITQKTGHNSEEIADTLNALPFTWREKQSKRGESTFLVNSRQLYEEVRSYGTVAYKKHIPAYVKELSQRQIRVFLDAFRFGDGSIHKGMKVYYSSSKEMADDLQELVLKSGGYASVSCVDNTGVVLDFGDHVSVRKQKNYHVWEWRRPVDIHIRMNEVERIHYSGDVWCFEVEPFHLLYVRREGKAMWAGNSGVVDRLREMGKEVEPFNGSERTDMKDKSRELGFVNKRSASWWNVREMLDPANQPTLALPPDDELTGDLVGITWRVTSGGKIQLESKDEVKKRLDRSPDSGDAVIYALWDKMGGVNVGGAVDYALNQGRVRGVVR